MHQTRDTDLDITIRRPIAHAIRVDPATFPAGDYEVFYTCSARCCMDALNRLEVAPNEYVYTGSGRWRRFTWGSVTDPDLLAGQLCRACGLAIPEGAVVQPGADAPLREVADPAARPLPLRGSAPVEQALPKFVFSRVYTT